MRFFLVTDQVQRELFVCTSVLYNTYPRKRKSCRLFHQTFHSKTSYGSIIQPYYLHMPNSPQYLTRTVAPPRELRGCVGKLENGYVLTDPLPSIQHPASSAEAISNARAPALASLSTILLSPTQ